MKNNLKALLLGILILGMFACTKKTPENTVSDTQVEIPTAPAPIVDRRNAESVDSLTAIMLRSLASKDKNLYVSYCFTLEQEETLADLIKEKKMKRRFQREFGFSLHEELMYFENILKYIEKSKIDLNKIDKKVLEVIDYNKSDYSPIVLKEVIIPIVQEGLERDIVYVAAQIDGRWYFTSELSL